MVNVNKYWEIETWILKKKKEKIGFFYCYILFVKLKHDAFYHEVERVSYADTYKLFTKYDSKLYN